MIAIASGRVASFSRALARSAILRRYSSARVGWMNGSLSFVEAIR